MLGDNRGGDGGRGEGLEGMGRYVVRECERYYYYYVCFWCLMFCVGNQGRILIRVLMILVEIFW